MAYNSAYTGSQVDAAVGAVRQKETIWDGKQDELTGTEDQLVGFNSAGEATPVPKPTAADVGALPTQTGIQGQVLGFTADNTVGAMDAPSGLPDGGTPGQMLYQGASGPEWGDKPVIYITITGSDDDGFTADKTAKEILNLVNNGFFVVAKCGAGQENSSYFYAPMVQKYVVGSTGEELYISFSFCSFADGSLLAANHTYASGFEQVYFDITSIMSSNVSFTPGSTGLTSNNVQDAIEEVNEKIPAKPIYRTVTLPASGWSNNTQTVTVQGVETSGQSVRISPATKTDAYNWVAAGVWCSEPTTANQLVFTCDTAPTENININVELQEVQS